MATTTLTAVTADGPRVLHSGMIARTALFNAGGATLSAGDVVQMIAIPHGAVIDEVIMSGNVGIAAGVITVGDGGDADRFVANAAGATLSGTSVLVRMNSAAGHGFKYSLSDDATTRYDTVDLTVVSASSVTVTCSIMLTVIYHMQPL